VAADFFTIEVWTAKGLQRYIVLFFIELSTRRVEIAGISAAANGLWMSQIARNLTDTADGFLTGKRHLIHDRDPLFTKEFLRTLKHAGVESVKLPPRSPNLNAHAERFVRSIKEFCLERLILFEEGSLRTAVQNFVAHYHSERNQQGLDNRLIQPETEPPGKHRRGSAPGTSGRHAELLLQSCGIILLPRTSRARPGVRCRGTFLPGHTTIVADVCEQGRPNNNRSGVLSSPPVEEWVFGPYAVELSPPYW
jgi:hypothetical protein